MQAIAISPRKQAASAAQVTVPPSASPRPVDFSDVVLYILARTATEEKADYKIRLSCMAEVLSGGERKLRDMGLPVRFDKTPYGVSSRQLDEALLNIIPFGITIQNPTFSLNVSASSANLRLELLKERLFPADSTALEQLYDQLRPELIRLGTSSKKE